jgi:hypothetical protein
VPVATGFFSNMQEPGGGGGAACLLWAKLLLGALDKPITAAARSAILNPDFSNMTIPICCKPGILPRRHGRTRRAHPMRLEAGGEQPSLARALQARRHVPDTRAAPAARAGSAGERPLRGARDRNIA